MDILRASTTMTTGLANGATQIVPSESVEQARTIAAQLGNDTLLGGERGGVRIEGFDLSNSPDDYDTETVSGKSVVFTTTNGTRAMIRAQSADEILVGAFVNLTRVVNHLQQGSRPIHIVCAGTDGEVTGEDVLFAGAVSTRVLRAAGAATEWTLNDSAQIALSWWQQSMASSDLEHVMLATHGGRNLRKLGFTKDIHTASQIDLVPVLGVYDTEKVILAAD